MKIGVKRVLTFQPGFGMAEGAEPLTVVRYVYDPAAKTDPAAGTIGFEQQKTLAEAASYAAQQVMWAFIAHLGMKFAESGNDLQLFFPETDPTERPYLDLATGKRIG